MISKVKGWNKIEAQVDQPLTSQSDANEMGNPKGVDMKPPEEDSVSLFWGHS